MLRNHPPLFMVPAPEHLRGRLNVLRPQGTVKGHRPKFLFCFVA